MCYMFLCWLSVRAYSISYLFVFSLSLSLSLFVFMFVSFHVLVSPMLFTVVVVLFILESPLCLRLFYCFALLSSFLTIYVLRSMVRAGRRGAGGGRSPRAAREEKETKSECAGRGAPARARMGEGRGAG